MTIFHVHLSKLFWERKIIHPVCPSPAPRKTADLLIVNNVLPVYKAGKMQSSNIGKRIGKATPHSSQSTPRIYSVPGKNYIARISAETHQADNLVSVAMTTTRPGFVKGAREVLIKITA